MNWPTVLVLASGRSERFVASGGKGDKLQARLAHQTVLQHTLDAVKASGLPWHLEDAGHPGMGDSVAAAVRATWHSAAKTGWLILPGDLPLIQSATLRAVACALTQHRVVVPLYQGRRGHPVGFAPECGTSLLHLMGERGAAGIVHKQQAFELNLNDIGCVTDIDTLADLNAAQRLLDRAAGAAARSGGSALKQTPDH